jgi:signal transduction histidine kinase
MFRIFQEALTNVVRHAGATRAEISLGTEDGDTLLLRICDNGKGIGRAGESGREGLGILGMHERARMFGGSVEIAPQIGNGTRVTARIPMIENAD